MRVGVVVLCIMITVVSKCLPLGIPIHPLLIATYFRVQPTLSSGLNLFPSGQILLRTEGLSSLPLGCQGLRFLHLYLPVYFTPSLTFLPSILY